MQSAPLPSKPMPQSGLLLELKAVADDTRDKVIDLMAEVRNVKTRLAEMATADEVRGVKQRLEATATAHDLASVRGEMESIAKNVQEMRDTFLRIKGAQYVMVGAGTIALAIMAKLAGLLAFFGFRP
jgi:hypothetical protein